MVRRHYNLNLNPKPQVMCTAGLLPEDSGNTLQR